MSAIFLFSCCAATDVVPVCCGVEPHCAQKGLLEAGGGPDGCVPLPAEDPLQPVNQLARKKVIAKTGGTIKKRAVGFVRVSIAVASGRSVRGSPPGSKCPNATQSAHLYMVIALSSLERRSELRRVAADGRLQQSSLPHQANGHHTARQLRTLQEWLRRS